MVKRLWNSVQYVRRYSTKYVEPRRENNAISIRIFSSKTTGPIVTKILHDADDGSEPHSPICQGTLPWQPNNFAVMKVNWYYMHSLQFARWSTVLSRYYLLGGDTVAPSRLLARLCHAFLVCIISCRRHGCYFAVCTVVGYIVCCRPTWCVVHKINLEYVSLAYPYWVGSGHKKVTHVPLCGGVVVRRSRQCSTRRRWWTLGSSRLERWLSLIATYSTMSICCHRTTATSTSVQHNLAMLARSLTSGTTSMLWHCTNMSIILLFCLSLSLSS